MSGDFVQRGLPAVVDKYRRTKAALDAGVDLVLELPVAFATASAEFFAGEAVRLLDSLGCVSDLVFGCETEDAGRLRETAALLLEEPPAYKELFQRALKEGLNFPRARALAMECLLPGSADFLRTPNNILAVEYQKALLLRGSSIRPVPVLRDGDGYHADGASIRAALEAGDRTALGSLMPQTTARILDYHAELDDFSDLLFYRLTLLSADDLTAFPDMTPDLAVRVYRLQKDCRSFSELVSRAVSKNLTGTRVRRALLHVLLDIREQTPLPLIRVLGLRRSSPVLPACRGSALPLVPRLADIPEELWAADLRAAQIYDRVQTRREPCPVIADGFRDAPVIVE